MNKVAKYRKRPLEVEAVQYDGKNGHYINLWSNGKVISSPVLEPGEDNPSGNYVQIHTLEGIIIGNPGDYIIKGTSGEFYPCKKDIFNDVYELVLLEEYY